ncbi:hypothetical protein ACIRD6_39305 [Streptomyces sp. NPDC102473]|uniref:hypothetical protein n=1 Tax=Streptomyces sp. NPDC102473 TaxID=3366180 RepID=UPI00380E68F1
MEDFEFNCWRCWETNVIQGRPKGFWTTTHYEVPSELGLLVMRRQQQHPRRLTPAITGGIRRART